MTAVECMMNKDDVTAIINMMTTGHLAINKLIFWLVYFCVKALVGFPWLYR